MEEPPLDIHEGEPKDLIAGNGGNDGGNGGAVNVRGGDGLMGTGGAVNVAAGHSGVGDGAWSTIASGSASNGRGGELHLDGGNSQSGAGGPVIITAGSGTTRGGDLELRGGSATVGSNGDGADVLLLPGEGDGTGGKGYYAVDVSAVRDCADDAAAASAGVPVGRIYRTGNLLKVRLS